MFSITRVPRTDARDLAPALLLEPPPEPDRQDGGIEVLRT